MSRPLLHKIANRALPPSFSELRQLRLAQDSFRDAGIVFIHVPRTAGLSITRAIYHSTVWCHFTLPQLLRHADKDILELPRFSIVRNPWERTVSAYHFAKRGGVPDGAQIQHPERYRGKEFETFDRFVREYLGHRNVGKLDGVFRPQTYYLGRESKNSFDYIGDFDRLPETEQWLSETLGRPIRLPKSNSTDHLDYRTYYSDETRDVIARAYRADIEMFGFQF